MPSRNDMLRALHAAARAAGLDDDAYRDKLESVTGKRSAKNCSDSELNAALDAFHVKPARTRYGHHAKIKALFIAAYNLGTIDTGTDAALDAFVTRQTGKERLGFVTPPEAAAVTEALKAMLAREGFVVPAADAGGQKARCDLLRAQWAKLYKMGAVKTDYPAALWAYAARVLARRHESIDQLSPAELDAVARRLGRWIRSIPNRSVSAA